MSLMAIRAPTGTVGLTTWIWCRATRSILPLLMLAWGWTTVPWALGWGWWIIWVPSKVWVSAQPARSVAKTFHGVHHHPLASESVGVTQLGLEHSVGTTHR